MKKRNISFIMFALLLLFVLSGCGAVPSLEQDENFRQYVTDNGVVYDDISPAFVFIIYPTRLIKEDGQKHIVYSFEVENKSEQDYKSFIATVIMNKQLDQYIAAGVVPLEYTGVDVAAKSKTDLAPGECRGIVMNYQQLLSDEQFMNEAGLDYKDIERLAEPFQILLKWDGGEAIFDFSQPVINELS